MVQKNLEGKAFKEELEDRQVCTLLISTVLQQIFD